MENGKDLITKEELHALIWRDQRRIDVTSKIAGILGPAGTIQLGLYTAQSYLATGREDLLIGGACLTALGVSILDAATFGSKLSSAFNRVADWVKAPFLKVSQSTLMAVSGLGACAALGGGEVLNYMQQSGHNLQELVFDSALRQEFYDSASSIKVAANAVPFLLASLPDVKSIRRGLENAVSQIGEIPMYQSFMAGIGNMLIVNYAAQIGAPGLGVSASLAAMMALGSVIVSFDHMFNLRYEDPVQVKKNGMWGGFEKLAEVRAAGLYEYYQEELLKMRKARGLWSPKRQRRAEQTQRELAALMVMRDGIPADDPKPDL